MDYLNDNQCLDWNGTLEKEENPLLKIGDYNGVVMNVERSRHNGSEKIPPCNKAIVTIRLDTEDGPVELVTHLLLHKKLEWKLSEFFRAIGQKKHGERLVMNWNTVAGSKIRVHVGINSKKGQDGEERRYNTIEKFYDFDPAFFPADPQWLQEAMAMDASEPLDEVF